jgi:hypothetical protein
MGKVQVICCGSSWGIGACRYFDEDGQEQMGYGFASPENPHDFFPDPESCTPEEIAAHAKAKADWDEAQSSQEGDK